MQQHIVVVVVIAGTVSSLGMLFHDGRHIFVDQRTGRAVVKSNLIQTCLLPGRPEGVFSRGQEVRPNELPISRRTAVISGP